MSSGHKVAQLIEALCYDPEGRCSIQHEVIRFLICPDPSTRTTALGLFQPLTEMSTLNLPGGNGGRPAGA
jgi:hypothetical protein